jgi:hypothetical protein
MTAEFKILHIKAWSVRQKMKKSFKKNPIVEWEETDFSHLHRVPKLRYQRKEYIHQTAIKYMEKVTDTGNHNLDILWKLLAAYESA